MTYWTPPNRGKTSTNALISTGQFPTMGEAACHVTWVRPEAGQSVSRTGLAKSGAGDLGTAAHRSHRLTSAAETYGPAGVVQVRRAFHGPGCPDCATTGRRPVRSAFASGEFRAGENTGRKG